MDKHICGSFVSIGQVQEFLTEHANLNETDYKINSWTCETIAVDKGFVSAIVRVTIDWKPTHKSLPQKIILKLPTSKNLEKLMDGNPTEEQILTEEEKKNFETEIVPIVHANECVAYELLAQEKPCPIPEVYYWQKFSEIQPGFIAMEDLSANSQMVNLFDGFNLEQIKSALEATAKLHAWSCLNRERWTGKVTGEHMKGMRMILGGFSKGLDSVSQNMPEYFPKDRMKRVQEAYHLEKMLSYLVGEAEIDIPKVLVHGDLWSNNLLYERKEGDEMAGDKLRAIIDWQTLHPGYFAEDVCRLLVFCCEPQVRKPHEKELLQHYYSHFCSMIRQNNPQNAIPFSFEDVMKTYLEVLPSGALLVISGLPMITGEHSPFLKPVPEQDREAVKAKFLSAAKSLSMT